MYIGKAAKLSGVSTKTIRYYESMGLLPSAERQGSYRVFSERDVRLIRLIKQVQELGFRLSEMKEALLANNHAVPWVEVCQLIRQKETECELEAKRLTDLSVQLNGRDVSKVFAVAANGRLIGLVDGLELGTNTLVARLPGLPEGSLNIINHPNGGPIFSGPQIQPWVCQQGAVDDQCNQPPEYRYLYKSINPVNVELVEYDPDNPPDDVATTTTENGESLPFIVREELGYQDRDQYKILTLYRPGMDWSAQAPQSQWNGKLLITHGGGCGADHAAGQAPLIDYGGTIPTNPLFEQSYIVALGQGYSVLSTALDNNGHNCNIALQAESLMMAKERFVEQYGLLRYTIGTGCSGGAIVQQQVSNAYPGIYQGLLTMCSYPDTFTALTQFGDYHLLRRYFEDPSRWALGVVWTPQQFADVEGHVSHINAAFADEVFFKPLTDPGRTCPGVDEAERYDAVNNPGGVRCGVNDYLMNVLGPRPPDVWTDIEKDLGRGFAGNAIVDNVGIQYGLNALREGLISPAQFVDLNVKVGGLTIDLEPQVQRTSADAPALAHAYRSGMINSGGNLDRVAMINFIGSDPGLAHDAVHGFWTRWRLQRELGRYDNHIMWSGPAPLIGDFNFVYTGLAAMDRWLSSIEQDTSQTPLAEKIVMNKPSDIGDSCSDGNGNFVLTDLCPSPILEVYSTPRSVAGDDNPGDGVSCALRPFNRDDDYGNSAFTEDQWQTLEEIFADGVCDYAKPPRHFQNAVEWLSYQNASGQAIYGGEPLPSASFPSGWASEAFHDVWPE